VDTYKRFLTNEVAPHITNNATVIIHGYTDTIGNAEYNMKLSERRAKDIRRILENGASSSGKKGVKYIVLAFGMDEENAPFENKLPEERFYNRTVIIDIVQPLVKE
jgi:outer membrane protein OmpA-like peptidoglycan-associated protein